ncbi:hypothetical protein DIPPA_31492 [Diplonema papillatum]|nr:hypothetical protein DIPPA_31492 [Diplonema papillatum]
MTAAKPVCFVCEKEASKYCCPKCRCRYCSVRCYKEHGAGCVRQFETREYEGLLRTEAEPVSAELKRETAEILRREAEKRRTDADPAADDTAAAATECLEQLSLELDAGRQFDAGDLAALEAQLPADLRQDLRAAFANPERLLREPTGDAENAGNDADPPFSRGEDVPWWKAARPAPADDAFALRLPGGGAEASRRVVVEQLPTGGEGDAAAAERGWREAAAARIEAETGVDLCGGVVHLVAGPPIDCRASQPLVLHALSAVSAYCLTLRVHAYDRSWAGDCQGACDMLLGLSPCLAAGTARSKADPKAFFFDDLADLVSTTTAAAARTPALSPARPALSTKLGGGEAGVRDPRLALWSLVACDLASFLEAPRLVPVALADAAGLFSKCRQELQGSRAKRARLDAALVCKKLEFFASLARSPFSLALFPELARDLAQLQLSRLDAAAADTQDCPVDWKNIVKPSS